MDAQKTRVTYSCRLNCFQIYLKLNGQFHLMATIGKDLIKNKNMTINDFVDLIKSWAGTATPCIDITASVALIELVGFVAMPDDELSKDK